MDRYAKLVGFLGGGGGIGMPSATTTPRVGFFGGGGGIGIPSAIGALLFHAGDAERRLTGTPVTNRIRLAVSVTKAT